MKNGSLLIISHTSHYYSGDSVFGWSPTVREINNLLEIFDEITHVANLKQGEPPEGSLSYISQKVKFIPIKAEGGKKIKDKLPLITSSLSTYRVIRNELKQADYFQFRAPTSIGVWVIPLLLNHKKTQGWFKYAGNWNQNNPPLSYKVQRYLLSQNSKLKVTINGKWADQPANCISFENPCLNKEERQIGQTVAADREFKPPYSFCFVGRVEEPKGVKRILEALASISPLLIDSVHFIGDGVDRHIFENQAKQNSLKVQFHGQLSRTAINEYYKSCDFIMLPSTASEGFPKVIAEAMNYGCIPIASNISGIPLYVKNERNGFLWEIESTTFEQYLNELLLRFSKLNLSKIAERAHCDVSEFTYEKYNEKLTKYIL